MHPSAFRSLPIAKIPPTLGPTDKPAFRLKIFRLPFLPRLHTPTRITNSTPPLPHVTTIHSSAIINYP